MMQKWTYEDIEEMKKLRRDGKTWDKIGEAFGVSGKCAYSAFLRNVGNPKLLQAFLRNKRQSNKKEDPVRNYSECTTRPMTEEEWAKYGPKNEIDRGSPLFWEAKRHTTERQRRLWSK